LLQSLIIFAVVASDIHWLWAQNRYFASLVGVGLAWFVTMSINEFRKWLAKRH